MNESAESTTGINLFDRTLKIIARNHADLFVRLALPGLPVQLVGTVENVELSLPVRPVDFIQRIMYDDQEYILHAEFQWEHAADFPRRICSYHGALTEQFKLPVLSFAIYLRYRRSPIPNEYVAHIGDQVVHRFTYPVLKLWEYTEQIRNGQYRELAPLLVMLTQNPDADLLQEECELILAEPDPQKRADLLALAISIAGRSFDRDFLWRFFREEVEQMRNATFIEDWVQEGVEKGIQQGLQQGLQQGRLEGEQTQLRLNILDVIVVRFDLTAPQAVQIARQLEKVLKTDDLSHLFQHALRDETLDEFQATLNTVTRNKPDA